MDLSYIDLHARVKHLCFKKIKAIINHIQPRWVHHLLPRILGVLVQLIDRKEGLTLQIPLQVSWLC